MFFPFSLPIPFLFLPLYPYPYSFLLNMQNLFSQIFSFLIFSPEDPVLSWKIFLSARKITSPGSLFPELHTEKFQCLPWAGILLPFPWQLPAEPEQLPQIPLLFSLYLFSFLHPLSTFSFFSFLPFLIFLFLLQSPVPSFPYPTILSVLSPMLLSSVLIQLPVFFHMLQNLPDFHCLLYTILP